MARDTTEEKTTTAPGSGPIVGPHLLENEWTLYFRPPAESHSSMPKAEAWEGSQRQMFTVDSVENFWKSWHQKVPRISPIHPTNCDYSLFKAKIKPMWEDLPNKNGGRWTVTLERRSRMAQGFPHMSHAIEQAWLDVMLTLIGEQFDPDGEKICGGVVGIRLNKNQKPNDSLFAKVSIWTKDASDEEANLRIGKQLRDVLKCPPNSLTYQAHEINGPRNKNAHKLIL